MTRNKFSLSRLVLPALALAALGLTAKSADAEIVTRTFPLPHVGISLDYGNFGYTDPDDNYVVLTGYDIVHTHAVIDYTPAPGEDPSLFTVHMVVPVTGANSEFLEILGSSFTETTPGHFHYELDSDDFNGTIRAGRYSLEIYSQDAEGNPISTAGVIDPTSGITFSVAIPEPTGSVLGFAPIATALLTRRRK